MKVEVTGPCPKCHKDPITAPTEMLTQTEDGKLADRFYRFDHGDGQPHDVPFSDCPVREVGQ